MVVREVPGVNKMPLRPIHARFFSVKQLAYLFYIDQIFVIVLFRSFYV